MFVYHIVRSSFHLRKKIPFAHIIKIHLLQFVSQQTACGQLHYSNYDILILFPQNNYPHAVFPLGIFSLAHMDRPLPNAALFYFLCSLRYFRINTFPPHLKKNTAAKNLPFCRTTAVDRVKFP